jgi:2-oxo-4-hydroxy-4-carboxy-5-ureidoimidazoline decarboxylase
VSVSLAQVNALPATACAELFAACCGSSRWVSEVVSRRPFASLGELCRVADASGGRSTHPIGSRRCAPPADRWNAQCVAAARARGVVVGRRTAGSRRRQRIPRSELAAINDAYESKFGFIYIVSAAGRSAGELLDIARARLTNDRDVELRIAAEEQRKITNLRLEKLIMEGA